MQRSMQYTMFIKDREGYTLRPDNGEKYEFGIKWLQEGNLENFCIRSYTDENSFGCVHIPKEVGERGKEFLLQLTHPESPWRIKSINVSPADVRIICENPKLKKERFEQKNPEIEFREVLSVMVPPTERAGKLQLNMCFLLPNGSISKTEMEISHICGVIVREYTDDFLRRELYFEEWILEESRIRVGATEYFPW